MENYRKLLSICVPTYNRGYVLDLFFTKMCPLVQKYGIQLNVSDNASPDDTQDVVKKYMQQYPNTINYVRQSVNIGPDQNFEFVLKMADTKYRWLMGDCCYIEEQSLSALLKDILSDQNYDVIVATDARKVRLRGASIVYKNPIKLFEDICWHMTWLSVLIYSDRMIENANFIRYYNSNFIQTGIIFEYFANKICNVKMNTLINVSSFVLEKRGHWISNVFNIFCKAWFHFVMSLPIYYPIESKLKCIMDHGKKTKLFSLRSLLLYRQKHYLDYKIYQKYRFYIANTVSCNKYVLLIISVIPHCVVNISISLLRKLWHK